MSRQIPEKGFITVIGSSQPREGEAETAYEIGRILGKENWGLYTGGRDGVMGETARGHSEMGGVSIGILPDYDLARANQYNTINIPTGIGFARNLPNVLAGLAVIVVGGSVGTLSELGYAILFRRPIFMTGFLPGVSNMPRATLLEIAPYADLTFCQDPLNLEVELKIWLERISIK